MGKTKIGIKEETLNEKVIGLWMKHTNERAHRNLIKTV